LRQDEKTDRGEIMHLMKKMACVAVLLALAGCQSAAHKSANVDDEDRCGAADYQQYVGKPLSAISDLRFEQPVRAIPYNSAVTMDFNLNRLNFLGDKQDKITRVYCG